ncbi:MAG TPA: hypothetical protein VLB09_02180 [Nitrospiria bacterium]|nr:hypothetical protein [Nitrospiria bacterium]
MEYSAADQRIGLEAVDAPLQDVLSSINKVTGIEFFVPRAINPEVTLSFKDMPMERGFEQIFRQALGSAKNAAMVYVAEEGPDGKTRHVLTEVRVVKGEAAVKNPSSSSRSVTPSRPVPRSGATPVRPGLSPEELAAKRAEKAAKRAEKESARAEKQAQKRSARGNRGGGGPKGSKGQAASPSTDPAAPSTKGSGGGNGQRK